MSKVRVVVVEVEVVNRKSRVTKILTGESGFLLGDFYGLDGLFGYSDGTLHFSVDRGTLVKFPFNYEHKNLYEAVIKALEKYGHVTILLKSTDWDDDKDVELFVWVFE